MARRTGLSVSLLSQIERAESWASISSLYKIAVALESRIQDLFGARTDPLAERRRSACRARAWTRACARA